MRRLLPTILAVLVLVACGTTASNTPATQPTEAAMTEKPTEAAMTEKPTEAAMAEKPTEAAMAEKPTEAAMAEKPTEAAMMDDSALPAWQTQTLVNARTGETFTLADFKGKTVFVETMATWCPNCRQQLDNVGQARRMLSGDDYVFVALSVETDLSQETLAGYANDHNFDWLFAVLTPEQLQTLMTDFGRTIANPPSTPHFIISPDGSASELTTGIDETDAIIMKLKAAHGE